MIFVKATFVLVTVLCPSKQLAIQTDQPKFLVLDRALAELDYFKWFTVKYVKHGLLESASKKGTPPVVHCCTWHIGSWISTKLKVALCCKLNRGTLGRADTRSPIGHEMQRGPESGDVQGAVGRPQVTGSHQDHVDQGPNAQATEAEQLANALLPHAQVEAVRAKATKHYAEH